MPPPEALAAILAGYDDIGCYRYEYSMPSCMPRPEGYNCQFQHEELSLTPLVTRKRNSYDGLPQMSSIACSPCAALASSGEWLSSCQFLHISNSFAPLMSKQMGSADSIWHRKTTKEKRGCSSKYSSHKYTRQCVRLSTHSQTQTPRTQLDATSIGAFEFVHTRSDQISFLCAAHQWPLPVSPRHTRLPCSRCRKRRRPARGKNCWGISGRARPIDFHEIWLPVRVSNTNTSKLPRRGPRPAFGLLTLRIVPGLVCLLMANGTLGIGEQAESFSSLETPFVGGLFPSDIQRRRISM
ncbi:hypothetical protein V8C34DRAFT_268443 [Trichoderma compactum]